MNSSLSTMPMGTSAVERDLKTLRASKLMSTCPEYDTMMVELEKFHKEQTKIKGRNENRELDLRPYLYDSDDTYEKPFYNILLKLLYEVASFQSPEKQHEDVLKVYEWFLSHQRLISDDSSKNENGGGIVDLNQNIEIPKLYFRPKSADGNCYRGSQTSPDMKYHRETHSKSALGSHESERIKKSKNYTPLDRISVSLKVLPLNVAAGKDEFGLTENMNIDSHSKFLQRNVSPSMIIYKPKRSPSLPSSFVLKPFNQTSPPVSSPVSSPSVSPRLSRRMLSPSHSPRSSPVARFCSNLHTPRSGKVAKVASDLEIEHMSLKTNGRRTAAKKNTEYDKDGGDGISNTNLVADEEDGMFQDQVKQRFQTERKKKDFEIVRNLQKETEHLTQERESLESQLVREHSQFLRDENEMHAGLKDRKVSMELFPPNSFSQNSSHGAHVLPTVNIYDISNHRPVSAVEFRNKGVHIESVLDMVQPVGEKMKYQREMRNGVSIWETEPATGGHDSFQRLHSAPPRFTAGLDRKSDNPKILKFTEPNLNPEMKANDYTVHFPHQSSREPTVKDFKVSGPVSPDSTRYQWTDDGFGNRTYFKRRSPVEPQPYKSPRSPTPIVSKDVAMVTGERGLDKRTIASLMVIKHLGTSRRRESFEFERDYSRFIVEDSIEPLYDDVHEDVKPKQNVEYLPFWKQFPQKKGLTIVNIPEHTEPDVNTGSKIITSEENRDTVKLTPSSSLTAQDILNEMFSSLTPQRRNLELDTSSLNANTQLSVNAHLSVNARSLSPEARRQPVNRHESRDLRPGPSPTPIHSRPNSARRSNKENIPPANFSVKHFSHFCFDDDLELMDDYKRQREIWAAINIQRIFRGHIARQYTTSLKQAERERQRKAAVALQSTFRGFLARKKLMRQNMMNYKPGVRDLQWAREYKGKLKEKESSRHRRNQGILRQQNRQFGKQQEQMLGVTASDKIHEIFNPPKPTKAQLRAAAITIQRYFRGWFVRKSLRTVKERALKRTFSFNKFIKSYQELVYRIQKRYNIENPNTALQFHELQEYVDRLFKYEIAFGKIAENGTLKYEDILKYFAECGHHPSEKEVGDAIAMVTKGPKAEIICQESPKGRNLTKTEAVEVVFQIYIPKGTGLSLTDVRKSTWTHPLIEGQDVKKILSKKDLKFTNLDKCLSLVADSQTDRNEVKELLRAPDPQIMNIVEKSQEKQNAQSKDSSGKQKPRQSSAKSPGGGNLILARAQYQPVKPSESKQNKKRRPVSGRTQK